ncbi:uncharacterized protein LOC111358362 [Spodoptera litura]|uniref:Uncharacterized protein LOC111358362 n=1 Tax=Spodoptera litura TaxID=69820 RepID=A0A9J7EDW6_SPOLT|nr:uncharacterized protein LOC111358362 [Spodoptera litura]
MFAYLICSHFFFSDMPRKYIRKVGVRSRAEWTQEALIAAMDEISRGILGINEISRRYGIPSRTLRRRFANKNTEKLTLGKHPLLDFENEKRLVSHIQKLEKAGFPPTRDMIRRLAFEFAEKLGKETNFNQETRKAGPHWLRSFLERNTELSIRQAEGLSVARAQGLNRDEVNKMFELLLKVMTEHDLLNKPDRIYIVDETGVQLNNSTGKVIATRGARVVHSVTSGEKGETLSVIACCNAVGNFLPPVVIIKGVNKKPEFQDGLPPGSEVYMNRKSAYVNAELFHKWLKEHLVPKKPIGKIILILDVPESFFAISDISLSNQRPTEDNAGENDAPEPEQVSSSRSSPVVDRVLSNVTPNYMDIFNRTEEALEQEPVPSNVQTLGSDLNLSNVSPCNTDRPDRRFSNSSPSILSQNNNIINIEELETPSKYLQESSPVPIVPVPFHKRGKQSAAILNTKENIEAKKSKVKGKATPGIRCKNKCQTAKADVQKKVLRTAVKFPKKIPAKCIKKRKGIRESSDETTISDISNESDSDFDQARVSEIDLHKKNRDLKLRIRVKFQLKLIRKDE